MGNLRVIEDTKDETEEDGIKFTVTRTTTSEPHKVTKTRKEELIIPSDMLASCRNLKELKELKRRLKKR